jgi:hypothetical protein
MESLLHKLLGKSWKTSAIGWALIIGGIASVIMGKTNWTDSAVTIGIGIGLLQAKDGDKK